MPAASMTPGDDQIAAFLQNHTEPLVAIPPEKMSAFQAGARAVLMLSPEARPGSDEPVWEIIGFAANGQTALQMLRAKITGLQSATTRDVFYYGSHLWPPIADKAFMPVIL